jgi:hypothetical protein
MKFGKKNQDPVKEIKEAADDVLEELDGDAMQQISGGVNRLAGLPRAENQSIDKDLRDNG